CRPCFRANWSINLGYLGQCPSALLSKATSSAPRTGSNCSSRNLRTLRENSAGRHGPSCLGKATLCSRAKLVTATAYSGHFPSACLAAGDGQSFTFAKRVWSSGGNSSDLLGPVGGPGNLIGCLSAS